jgi:excisionase family DNA binding protein
MSTATASDTTTHRYLTYARAAAYLSVSAQTIRRWVTTGRLLAHRPSERIVLFDVRELDALIRGQLEPNTKEQS